MSGFLVKIDQEKAFDRVNHTYLFKVLLKFGFPDFSDYFPISRGIRQGCPLSAILYVLSAEPMRNAIVNNPDIKGFDVEGTPALFFQHADDSTAMVHNISSVNQVFDTFKKYNKASGSKDY